MSMVRKSENNGLNELAVASRQHDSGAMTTVSALSLQTMEEAITFARMAAQTGMYGLTSAEEAFMRLATGIELGLKPAQSMRLLYSFRASQGSGPATVGLYADTMLALCLRQPDLCEYFDFVEITADHATYATKRRGRPEQTLTFTKAQAVAAGYVGRNAKYNTEPEVMLKARCIARLARLVYPDILGGMYTPEELAENAPDDLPGARVIPEPSRETVHMLALAGQGQNGDNTNVEFKKPEANGVDSLVGDNAKLCKEIWPTDTKKERDKFIKDNKINGNVDLNAALKSKLDSIAVIGAIVEEIASEDTTSPQDQSAVIQESSDDPFQHDPNSIECEWEGCATMIASGSSQEKSSREDCEDHVFCPRHLIRERARRANLTEAH